MLSELMSKLGVETIERLVRIESEKAINDGITAGEDSNTIAKRVFMAMFSDSSKLIAAARAIPGLKYAPHLIFTTAAEVLNRSVDKFLPGDQRSMVRMVRLALKASAPALIGMGEAATDVIERRINEAVDRTISPNSASSIDRTKSVDLIAVIENPLLGVAHPFFPIARDDKGAIRKTVWGHPLVLDLYYLRFIEDYEKRNPHKEEKHADVGIVRLYTLSEWASIAQASGAEIETEKLEQIKQLLAPQKAHEWSSNTWAVIRAYMRSSAEFQRSGQLDWLDHEEAEGLVQTLLKGKPDHKLVNELLGESFFSRIGQNAPEGEFSFDVLVEIETQAMDKWLGGEQPAYTKVVRAVRKMRRFAVSQGNSVFYVAVAFLGITIAIWSPILVGVILLVVALDMYMDGLSGSAGKVLLNNGDAVRLMLYSGGLVFFVTMMFPFAQTMLSWIKYLFPRVKEDWLVDTGRKISGFTLTLVSVTAIAIILNVPPSVRDFIPLMFLGSIGVGFILILANARSEAERSAILGAKILGAAFTLFLVVGVFVYGVYLGNADSAQAMVGTTTSSFSDIKSYFASSRWLQLALIFTGLLVGSVVRSMFEYRKVPSGTRARLRIHGAGILTVAIAASLIAYVFSLPSNVQVKSSASVTSTVPPDPVVTTPAPAGPVKVQKHKSICDEENLSQYQREKIGCPNPVTTTAVTPAPAQTLKQHQPSSLCDDKQISFHQRQKLGCKN